MYIKKIELNNFRNYEQEQIILDKNVNIIYGNNGEGKTNILESVFVCALGKSFRTSKEKELIRIGQDYAKVNIDFEKDDRVGNIKINIDNKKSFFLNDVKLNKTSEVLGNIYVVLFNPDDINILKQGPANRRRFLNIMISQLRPNYVHLLNNYMKVLEQRNIYLRQIKYENKDINLLEIWDEKLAELGEKIYEYRKDFIEKIIVKINKIHQNITNEKETIKIIYSSNCSKKQDYLNKLKNNKNIDLQKGYTTLGIHRDDFSIYINDKLVNVYGSQGQQRTVIISLKLSELEIIYDEIGEKPILLLDDFISELDKNRREYLLNNFIDNQIIITCTDNFALKNSGKIFKVENGKVL